LAEKGKMYHSYGLWLLLMLWTEQLILVNLIEN